jgi:MoaA/NifB/PqqE/SkfB family radical SAM enzyme
MKYPVRKIVKAEILFSRQCPLSCSYCGMKNEKQNTRTSKEWRTGLLKLYELGCEFIAFYGAEPLTEFEKLKDAIYYCESALGIPTTIITSGAVPNFWEKMLELHKHGARSLSMSYDPNPIDPSSMHKSNKAIFLLKNFKKLYNVRDVAAIATLTAKNFMYFPEMVEKMSKDGIWSFFDLIHEDRGQPGSKCGKVAEDLKLKPEHHAELLKMFEKFLKLKDEGALCHSSQHFVDTITSNMLFNNDIYTWTCNKQDPSWVTIDCDGSVLLCDDLAGVYTGIDMTNLYRDWDIFKTHHHYGVKDHDCKCCWNTHIDAHAIMAGEVKLEDYVHDK